MINRADKAALLPVQKIHSLAGIYTGVYTQTFNKAVARLYLRIFALNSLEEYLGAFATIRRTSMKPWNISANIRT